MMRSRFSDAPRRAVAALRAISHNAAVEVQPCIRLDSTAGYSRWQHAEQPSLLTLRCDSTSRVTVLSDASGARRTWSGPLEALSWMQQMIRAEAGDSSWVGYLNYDLGRLFETLPVRATDDLNLPLFLFTLHAGARSPLAVSHSDSQKTTRRRPLTSNFTRLTYEQAVDRAIDYIRAGDVFQVNLSQRFSCSLREHPRAIYDRLRAASPAAYGAYLDYGDLALICNSPELFFRVTPQPDGTRKIITRPIKGTRPLLPGMETALRNSAKDQAELNMIVDLERNDLGRICEIGSVHVTQPREIEAHPTVYHGVATIEGTLRPDVTFTDILRATFPGGSVTGAPKIT